MSVFCINKIASFNVAKGTSFTRVQKVAPVWMGNGFHFEIFSDIQRENEQATREQKKLPSKESSKCFSIFKHLSHVARGRRNAHFCNAICDDVKMHHDKASNSSLWKINSLWFVFFSLIFLIITLAFSLVGCCCFFFACVSLFVVVFKSV